MEIKRKLKLPSLPNFLRFESQREDGESVDVADLTDEQLRELGTEWQTALVRHAQARRHNRKMLDRIAPKDGR